MSRPEPSFLESYHRPKIISSSGLALRCVRRVDRGTISRLPPPPPPSFVGVVRAPPSFARALPVAKPLSAFARIFPASFPAFGSPPPPRLAARRARSVALSNTAPGARRRRRRRRRPRRRRRRRLLELREGAPPPPPRPPETRARTPPPYDRRRWTPRKIRPSETRRGDHGAPSETRPSSPRRCRRRRPRRASTDGGAANAVVPLTVPVPPTVVPVFVPPSPPPCFRDSRVRPRPPPPIVPAAASPSRRIDAARAATGASSRGVRPRRRVSSRGVDVAARGATPSPPRASPPRGARRRRTGIWIRIVAGGGEGAP